MRSQVDWELLSLCGCHTEQPTVHAVLRSLNTNMQKLNMHHDSIFLHFQLCKTHVTIIDVRDI